MIITADKLIFAKKCRMLKIPMDTAKTYVTLLISLLKFNVNDGVVSITDRLGWSTIIFLKFNYKN